jgi:hypothetical protein
MTKKLMGLTHVEAVQKIGRYANKCSINATYLSIATILLRKWASGKHTKKLLKQTQKFTANDF